MSVSSSSDSTFNLNIYEEVLKDQKICDCSSQGIEDVPQLSNKLICVLYLQNNKIKCLPDDFFPSLPALMWLDLRNNQLTDLPKTIKSHPALTHLLLQNNKLTSLPYELGTVPTLKVLQLSGNPLMFPSREIINAGVSKIINYLHEKYIENIFVRSQSDFSEETGSACGQYNENTYNNDVLSYNSVLDEQKLKKTTNLVVELNEKESEDSDEEYFAKIKGKCPKLAKSRHKTLPTFYQSAKYLKPLSADSQQVQNEKIKQSYLRDLAIKKHKDLLVTRDKILQGRKNMELLRNWRKNYRYQQCSTNSNYRMEPKHFPYDTNPEFMTLLTREDIEKDLPDKYKKRLVRKCKPSVPRKSNNDVHLALKIKQLFENLEAIDLNKEGLTPRTEQKVLMNEIQKISEIKQKLQELSTTNVKSVLTD